jgi:hypothetical protein
MLLFIDVSAHPLLALLRIRRDTRSDRGRRCERPHEVDADSRPQSPQLRRKSVGHLQNADVCTYL